MRLCFCDRCSDPRLFHNVNRPPQYPQERCRLPEPATTAEERRRLLAVQVSREDAEEACKDWNEKEKEGCIYDVLATGDKQIAEAGAY